jgi:hypothetical protein
MFRRVICSGSVIGGGSGRSGRAFDALVGPVVVVEDFELTQGADKVVLVPDQGAVEELTAAGLYPPLHDRVHSWHPHTGKHTLILASARTASNSLGNFPSRSRIKNRTRHPAS